MMLNEHLIAVCGRDCMFEGWSNFKFMDMADSLCNLGIDCAMVLIYANL